MINKTIMNFGGCDVVLSATDTRLIENAETEIVRVMYREFGRWSAEEVRAQVVRDLAV